MLESKLRTYWTKIALFFQNPRNLFLFGFILVFALTFSEVSRGRHRNFMIFAESTKLFWDNITPYGTNWSQHISNLDVYLYSPLFNLLFAPFAFLPDKIAPLVWNLFNFTLWFLAIFKLPIGEMTAPQRSKTILYTLLILACTQLSMQYNVAVGYIYLFAFSLLERDKPFWAVLLIMISGITKVYGVFQLAMLLFYPKFWRNMLYVVGVGAVLILAPSIAVSLERLPDFYGEWINALLSHKDSRVFHSVFYLKGFNLLAYQVYIQLGVLLALAIGVFCKYREWSNLNFRISALAILMGYIILFGNSSETHTYVITIVGYQIWYWMMYNMKALTRFDNTLYWLIFIVVIAMPVDVICPVGIKKIFFDASIHIWLLIAMWFRICQRTLYSR